jgi:hypothetical protein
MANEDLQPRKIEFDGPVTESQLQDILESTVKDLGLAGDWHFEHGYQHNELVSHARNERVHGFIRPSEDQSHAITEFTAGNYIGHKKVPVFSHIEFSPSSNCETSARLYPQRIEQIYNTFNKNYEIITKSKK